MTREKTQHHTETNENRAAPSRLSLEFDPFEFPHFLEETDWTDEQKAEYAALVWNIVCEFVAMGFGVHPIQQEKDACGKAEPSGALPPSAEVDVVNSSHSEIIGKFVRLRGSESVLNGEGIIDG